MASVGLLASDAAVDAAIQPINAYNIDLHFQGTAAGKVRKRWEKTWHCIFFLMKNSTKSFGRGEKKTGLIQ